MIEQFSGHGNVKLRVHGDEGYRRRLSCGEGLDFPKAKPELSQIY